MRKDWKRMGKKRTRNWMEMMGNEWEINGKKRELLGRKWESRWRICEFALFEKNEDIGVCPVTPNFPIFCFSRVKSRKSREFQRISPDLIANRQHLIPSCPFILLHCAGWLAGVVLSNPIYEQMAQLTFLRSVGPFFSHHSIASFGAFIIRSFSL